MSAEPEFYGLTDKRNTLLLLGCYCNFPKYINNPTYSTIESDYSNEFHRIVWGCLVNIAKKGIIGKITAIEIENELSLFKKASEIFKDNDGFNYIEKAIKMTKDKEYNIALYRDNVKKYSVLRNAVNMLHMDISFIYEEFDELNIKDIRLNEKKQKMQRFFEMTYTDVKNAFNARILSFKSTWDDGFEDNYSFRLGDDIDTLVASLKNKDNSYGYPYQSAYMTTILRGMRFKKFALRSSISGGGKSRLSMADACNIGCNTIYDWNTESWISTGQKDPVLYISTELTKEEIQTCILAHISGVEEDRIVDWDGLTEKELEIIYQSAELMKDCLVFGEYMPDFTIDSITDKIEQYVLNYNIKYCFFDYINDSPSLYSYYIQKTGVRLQTHQILFLFSESLKRVCNKYDIFLGSSTQLNSNWKDEKDANALKGSKAIAEKVDTGELCLPATSDDLKKLEHIIKEANITPNYCHIIYKNRGNKWNAIMVWTQFNKGTTRELDCFVTNMDYELIAIEPTKLDFTIETASVGNVGLIEDEGTADPNELLDKFENTEINDVNEIQKIIDNTK